MQDYYQLAADLALVAAARTTLATAKKNVQTVRDLFAAGTMVRPLAETGTGHGCRRFATRMASHPGRSSFTFATTSIRIGWSGSSGPPGCPDGKSWI